MLLWEFSGVDYMIFLYKRFLFKIASDLMIELIFDGLHPELFYCIKIGRNLFLVDCDV